LKKKSFMEDSEVGSQAGKGRGDETITGDAPRDKWKKK